VKISTRLPRLSCSSLQPPGMNFWRGRAVAWFSNVVVKCSGPTGTARESCGFAFQRTRSRGIMEGLVCWCAGIARCTRQILLNGYREGVVGDTSLNADYGFAGLRYCRILLTFEVSSRILE
jgi:hypothetical protein